MACKTEFIDAVCRALAPLGEVKSRTLSEVEDEKEIVDGRKKRLSEMTLDELWQLFPIELVAHRPEWQEWAAIEIAELTRALEDFGPAISHVGSTAIPAIMAKPTVDILIEMRYDTRLDEIRRRIEGCGYLCMSVAENRMSFNKGYTPEGYADRVFHVHVHPAGDNDEIYFRDYLNSHPETAREYEALKLSLLSQYRHDRDGYTAAKAEFVGKVSALARAE